MKLRYERALRRRRCDESLDDEYLFLKEIIEEIMKTESVLEDSPGLHRAVEVKCFKALFKIREIIERGELDESASLKEISRVIESVSGIER